MELIYSLQEFFYLSLFPDFRHYLGMDHWSKRLWKALNWKGWSQRELSRRAGVDEQKVYKYLQGKVDNPRGDTLLRLSDSLGVTEAWLRFGVGPAVVQIPVVGRVAAGESFLPFDDSPLGSGYEEIEFTLDDADPIAIEVRGESMLPVYRPGDYLLCSRRRGDEIQRCLNKDCVVKTDQGEGYVKKLLSGPTPGTFTLMSYNAAPIEGVRLLWAAPIIWVKRA
jgi:transcriptional regulator with XRE-family HTH domain